MSYAQMYKKDRCFRRNIFMFAKPNLENNTLSKATGLKFRNCAFSKTYRQPGRILDTSWWITSERNPTEPFNNGAIRPKHVREIPMKSRNSCSLLQDLTVLPTISICHPCIIFWTSCLTGFLKQDMLPAAGNTRPASLYTRQAILTIQLVIDPSALTYRLLLENCITRY